MVANMNNTNNQPGTNLCYEVLYLFRDAMELVSRMGEELEKNNSTYYSRKVNDLRTRASELLAEEETKLLAERFRSIKSTKGEVPYRR